MLQDTIIEFSSFDDHRNNEFLKDNKFVEYFHVWPPSFLSYSQTALYEKSCEMIHLSQPTMPRDIHLYLKI